MMKGRFHQSTSPSGLVGNTQRHDHVATSQGGATLSCYMIGCCLVFDKIKWYGFILDINGYVND